MMYYKKLEILSIGLDFIVTDNRLTAFEVYRVYKPLHHAFHQNKPFPRAILFYGQLDDVEDMTRNHIALVAETFLKDYKRYRYP